MLTFTKADPKLQAQSTDSVSQCSPRFAKKYLKVSEPILSGEALLIPVKNLYTSVGDIAKFIFLFFGNKNSRL